MLIARWTSPVGSAHKSETAATFIPKSNNVFESFKRTHVFSVYVAPRLNENICVPIAPLEEIVQRSELLPPTFGEIALGGGDLTVVVLSDDVVTVDVVFCVIVLSSTAITGNTNTIQNARTINPAITLLRSLSDIRLLVQLYEPLTLVLF